MRTMRVTGLCLLFWLSLGVSGAQAQQSAALQEKSQGQGQQSVVADPELPRSGPDSGAAQSVVVPRLVKFSGVLHDATGQARSGVVGVTFAIYREQEGGAALWLETQNVQVDEQGHYAVLLGATKNEGLPVELFAAAEPRWLGVQLAGEAEQPRVLLVSVPYALRAVDAENLGGRPASAYALADGAAGTGASGATGGSETGTRPVPTKNKVTTPGGKATPQLITASFVPVFTDSNGTLANSLLVQSGNSMALGQGLSGNSSIQFDVNGGIRGTGLATGGRNVSADAINTGALFLGGSNAMGVVGTNAQFAPGALFTKTSFFSGGAERMTIDGTTGNVGIGSTSPFRKLEIIDTGNTGLRVQTNATGGTVASFGGSGDFQIDAPNVFGGRFVVTQSGNVGVGTTSPRSKVDIAGGIDLPYAASALNSNPAGIRWQAGADASTAFGFAVAGGLWFQGSVPNNPNFGVRLPTSGATLGPIAFVVEGGSGDVGIGTATPGVKLDVVGDIRTTSCFEVNSTVVSGTCLSDLRLKTNIQPFSPVLAKLARLRPVHFDWRTADYPERHFDSSRSSGLIAQEVEKVLPELVSVDAQGFKRVNYTELPYLMLEAIRELKAQNDRLQSQVKELRAVVVRIADQQAVERTAVEHPRPIERQ